MFDISWSSKLVGFSKLMLEYVKSFNSMLSLDSFGFNSSDILKPRKFSINVIFIVYVSLLSGCFEGPSVNPNSGTAGNEVGYWRLKVEGYGAFDQIYGLSITESGHFLKTDSSCYVGASASENPCTVKYRFGGKYRRSTDSLVFYRVIDSTDVMIPGSTILDTMHYTLRRLDEDALVMVYRPKDAALNDSVVERFYRVK